LAQWQESQGVVLDPEHFQRRWVIFVAMVAAAGSTLLVAGSALLRRHHWGLLAISAVAIVLVLYPCVFRWLGLARYGFESIEPLGTALCLAVAIAAVAAYFRSSHRVAT
jgi:hypothetical protein